ncbi:hypothetical protein QOT17_006598 [Balamuthia mandrillaris]
MNPHLRLERSSTVSLGGGDARADRKDRESKTRKSFISKSLSKGKPKRGSRSRTVGPNDSPRRDSCGSALSLSGLVATVARREKDKFYCCQNIHEMFSDDDCIDAFKFFLVTEQSGLEELEFYLRVEQWKQAPTLEGAKQIFQQFLACPSNPSPAFPLSLASLPSSSSTEQSIDTIGKALSKVDNGKAKGKGGEAEEKLPITLFQTIQEDVFSFLERKRFPSFKKSAYYECYVEECQEHHEKLVRWLQREEMDQLVLAMRDPTGGVEVRSIRSSLSSSSRQHWKKVFRGKEGVDWVMHFKQTSREIAHNICQNLLDDEYIHAIEIDENSQDKWVYYDDDSCLYRFQLDEESSVLNAKKIWTESRKPSVVIQDLLSTLLNLYRRAAGEEACISSRKTAAAISHSEEFKKFSVDTGELQKVNLEELMTSEEQRMAFFINAHNLLALHAHTELLMPKGKLAMLSTINQVAYNIGGLEFTLPEIEHAILRAAHSPRSHLFGCKVISVPRFTPEDKRYSLRIRREEPLLPFSLSLGLGDGVPLRVYTANNLRKNLLLSAQEYLLINLQFGDELPSKKDKKEKRNKKVYLPQLIHYNYTTFGKDDTSVLLFLFSTLNSTTSSLTEEESAKLDRIRHLLQLPSPSGGSTSQEPSLSQLSIKWKDQDWQFFYRMSSTTAATKALTRADGVRKLNKIEVTRTTSSGNIKKDLGAVITTTTTTTSFRSQRATTTTDKTNSNKLRE